MPSGLARKYAQALINHKEWYNQDILWIDRLNGLAYFMAEQRHHFWYGSEALYRTVLETFGFAYADFDAVLQLLRDHQRLPLFFEIVEQITLLYRKHHTYELCTVRSSHALTEQQKNFLIEQLEKRVGKKLQYQSEVDSRLIAGIRVQGESFVWEHSIAQQLRLLEQRIFLWK